MAKLLIADDEPAVRSLVRMTLEDEGYEILEASSGDEALRRARSDDAALVLLDISMPGLSGLEVCRTLKSDPATKGIVVVMLTARAREADRNAGIVAGADGYLTKPFSPLQLLETVDDLLMSDAERRWHEEGGGDAQPR